MHYSESIFAFLGSHTGECFIPPPHQPSMFHQGSYFITTWSCSKSEMRARAVGQDSCCWLPGRHSWHAGRFLGDWVRRIRGFCFFSSPGWRVWGLRWKGVEGLTEDGRRDGASPSEALSIPPAYGMADVSWSIHDNTAACQGHTAVTWPRVCVFVRARVSRICRSIRAYLVTLIFTQSDREATSVSISTLLDGHLSTPFFQPSTGPPLPPFPP